MHNELRKLAVRVVQTVIKSWTIKVITSLMFNNTILQYFNLFLLCWQNCDNYYTLKILAIGASDMIIHMHNKVQ